MRDAKILIIKNISHEGPGILAQVLAAKNLPYKIVDLDKGETFPDPEKYKALIVLGGPESANDQNKKISHELAQIKKTLDKGIPYLGICLGLQLMVKADGGRVVKNHTPEIGFLDPNNDLFQIDLSEAGQQDPLFQGLSSPLPVFHLHGETVEITPQMQLLGTGKFCQNQVVKIGANAYGLQCHFELTPEMFQDWIKKDPDLQKIDQTKLEKDFESIADSYRKTGQTLFQNFLSLANMLE